MQLGCIKKIIVKLILQKPDTFGALASTLCVVHCLATPLIFIAHACGVNDGCATTPIWWQSLDYLFLIIGFIAVYRSAHTTSKKVMKLLLWGIWILLFIMIINEKLALFKLSEYYTYLFAMLLASLHLYNLKYCQCKASNCCVKNEQRTN